MNRTEITRLQEAFSAAHDKLCDLLMDIETVAEDLDTLVAELDEAIGEDEDPEEIVVGGRLYTRTNIKKAKSKGAK